MLEKWRQWALKMNLGKVIIIFMITVFVVVIGFSAVVYQNFQGRIFEWKQFTETDRDYGRKEYDKEHKSDSGDWEHDREFKEGKEKDMENISKRLYLSAGDLALIAGCCIIEIRRFTIWESKG